MKKPALQSLIWFVGLASTLQAGTISYSDVEVLLPTGTVGTFTVPQYFDPGGMPLVKVTLTVAGDSFGGTHIFDNEDLAGGMATVTVGSDIKVNGPTPGIGAVLVVHAEPLSSNSGIVVGDNDGLPPDFMGLDSISVTGTLASDLKSASKTSPFDMAPYMGAGLVTMDYMTTYNTAGSFSTTGGGWHFHDPTTVRAAFTATVTYEFIPEPSTLTLAGLALATLVRWRRITRSK